MANKIDLSKLRDEIDTRKKDKGIPNNNSSSGSVGNSNLPKDSFLNELVESLNSGRESKSTKLIKMVESKAVEKNGDVNVDNKINENKAISKTPQQPTQNVERDDLLYEELNRRKKEMLNNGVSNYHNKPIQNEINQQQSGLITENKLNEAVDNIIKEKFAHIVEQAMKDSIVEIYAETRMKEVLDENKEYIKDIVIETIRSLQKKKKPQ